MFDMRAKIALRFWHVANRVWVVTEENVLMDWTSTTIFKEAEDKPAVVPEFTVMKLGKVCVFFFLKVFSSGSGHLLMCTVACAGKRRRRGKWAVG